MLARCFCMRKLFVPALALAPLTASTPVEGVVIGDIGCFKIAALIGAVH